MNKYPECPFPYGSEQYHVWWESFFAKAIPEFINNLNIDTEEGRRKANHYHFFDRNHLCRCGVTEIEYKLNQLNNPIICEAFLNVSLHSK